MRDTKPFASLSSGLLARKGAAKPAMRPQGFASFGGNLEDLGWNDMGHHEPDGDPDEHHHSASQGDVAPLTGAAGLTPSRSFAEPQVVAHQRALEQQFAPAPEPSGQPEVVVEHQFAPAPAAPVEPEAVVAPVAARVVSDTVVALPCRRVDSAKSKAAFTLRLDTERHLKLRLACALTRVSAQQLVTGALDDFLKSLPEVDRLADRVPAASGR
jgi:hypothetical protein